MKTGIITYIKGIAMGSADVVPGVSGGTIAFITGIYETLLDAIKAIDNTAVRLLFRLNFRAFWKRINGNFLFPLLLGILTSLLTLTRIIVYLLAHHPIPLWSFFFGLIIISAILVLRSVRHWKPLIIMAGLVGIGIAYFITVANPVQLPAGHLYTFLSGTIAICAMILPGISGSFILLILGKYEYIIHAVNEMDYATISIFAAGCVVGLLSFARVVSWLFKHYHDITIAMLAGFMIGSLNKVWPWKVALSFRINSAGEQVAYLTQNVTPAEYMRQIGDAPQVLMAILFLSIGIGFVVLIEKIASFKSTRNSTSHN